MTKFLTIETQSGQTMNWRGSSIKPFFQSIQLRIPGSPAAVLWKRPVSVLVSNQEDQETVLPIKDVTFQIIFTIITSSILLTLFFRMFFPKRK